MERKNTVTNSPGRRPRTTPRVHLGERRTLLEELPDSGFLIGSTVYSMKHQVCVPGGWSTVAEIDVSAPAGLAGAYGPVGQMLANPEVRRQAAKLFDETSKQVRKQYPYARLSELVSKVQLQEGTGEVGGWDDPGVAVEMADLLHTLIT